MTGPAFMRPYPAHSGHIIKMADETRNGTPVALTDDTELLHPLKPSTIYMVRIMLFFTTGAVVGNVWYPACTSALDFAALFGHKAVANDATDKWNTATTGDHTGTVYDTARFNAQAQIGALGGARTMTGMIQTGSSGGTFSIVWGGANGSRTLHEGSFMYLKEAQPY